MRRLHTAGTAIAFASLWMPAVPASAQISMTIVDPAAASLGLFSDGRGLVAPNLYIDSTLPGGDLCASGATNPTGYTVFYPDVKLSNGTFCNAGIDPSVRRTYTFAFPAGGVNGPCYVLNLRALPNSNGAYGPCTVTIDDVQYERVILNDLFAKKAKTTAIHVALVVPATTQIYSLQLDQEATVVLDTNTNVRTAVYSGTAKLYAVLANGSVSSTAATSSFSFPLQIRIQQSK